MSRRQRLGHRLLRWISKMLEGTDGKPNEIRALLLLLGIAFIGLSTYQTVISGKFDGYSFGIGAASLLGGGGAGQRWRDTLSRIKSLSSSPTDPPN